MSSGVRTIKNKDLSGDTPSNERQLWGKTLEKGSYVVVRRKTIEGEKKWAEILLEETKSQPKA